MFNHVTFACYMHLVAGPTCSKILSFGTRDRDRLPSFAMPLPRLYIFDQLLCFRT